MNIPEIAGVVTRIGRGEVVGQIFEGSRRFAILVRFAPEYRNTSDAISNILIPGPERVRW